jgi:hypothetical protein
MTSFPAKFCHVDANGNYVPHDYGNSFFVQPCGNTQRLVIGPSTGQVRLLERLAEELGDPPFYVLYVLLQSHAGNKLGRYQSPPLQSSAILSQFLQTFSEFLEHDGRHHLWVSNGADVLVYDQHNVIFAYGALDKFQKVLEAEGYTNREFWFPAPHTHAFPPANAELEKQLLAHFLWQHSEFRAGDQWD